MSLSKYKAKRSFDKTPEPTGGKSNTEVLRFVIQKHAASHLHYDFRLEMKGVLKSWAVPKGPSTDPDIKRLAMMVEDHPYDYRTFEGIIPAGQYGGGTVIVWDEGTYESASAIGEDKKTQEKDLIHGLYSGKLHFILKGKKLKGEYALVKTKGRGENAWLLMKIEDKYVSKDDITLKDKSVVSRKTLEQVAASSTNIYGQKSPTRNKSAAKPAKKKQPVRAGSGTSLDASANNEEIAAVIKKAKPKAFPSRSKAMAYSGGTPPDNDSGWCYEVAWKGQRCLAFINKKKARLTNEAGKDISNQFPSIYRAVSEWPTDAVVDGELVVLNKDGTPSGITTSEWSSSADGQLVYYVFDILWLEGKDLTPLPLTTRHRVLKAITSVENNTIRLSEQFATTSSEFAKVARELGLKAIIAKKEDSIYTPGKHSNEWIEIAIRSAKTAAEAQKAATKGKAKPHNAGSKQDLDLLLNKEENTQVKKVNRHELKFTNLSKLYWPDDGISKRDMINYYHEIAPYMLPYLKGRPMSLNRHPEGINGHAFYQKDVTGKAPSWIETMPYRSDSDPAERNFLVCTNEASLLYMASLGCIEMNPWSSTVRNPHNPTWCIIDLDPGKTTFDQVIEAARVTKDVLDAAHAPSYCKTSGSKGIHIYIPLGGKYSYEQSKELARVIAALVNEQLPDFTSIERTVSRRKGKMYIDFLQNRPQATLAAPYSLRPKPGATVSMPLHWDEVKRGLRMLDFTIHNALERVKNEGDLFKPVLGKGIDLAKVVKALGNL